MVGEINRIGGPEEEATTWASSLVANEATNANATIIQQATAATKTTEGHVHHQDHRHDRRTDERLDVKRADEWRRRRRPWRRHHHRTPPANAAAAGVGQSMVVSSDDLVGGQRLGEGAHASPVSRAHDNYRPTSTELIPTSDARVARQPVENHFVLSSFERLVPLAGTAAFATTSSHLPAANTYQYEDNADLTDDRRNKLAASRNGQASIFNINNSNNNKSRPRSNYLTTSQRATAEAYSAKLGRRPTPIAQPRTALPIWLASSSLAQAAPIWNTLIFLLLLISLTYSNHCYCQLSTATKIRSQRLVPVDPRGLETPDERRNLPAQSGAFFKRRRQADIVQFEPAHYVALGRPLGQARAAALVAPQEPRQQQEVMPYKTYYVTQACEWKSNLFVPKSNDIHFAQQPAGSQAPDQAPTDEADSRTILSTSQKALVLALPLSLGPSFVGYEPACSIRLIVPRNMRILAKLTTRRLTLEQEQVVPSQQAFPFGTPGSFGAAEPNLGARGSQLWLNVSQNQFSETEQRIIETEGNVLAFRFLLERFANRQAPEIRFQVVLTAFQTFGENSDFNQPTSSIAWQPQAPPSQSFQPDGPQQNAQFICDSQRLISAHLACDGFKNCQDGHDEEPATCLALRNQQQPAAGNTIQHGPATSNELPVRNQQDGSQSRPNESAATDQRGSWLTQLINYLTRDSSPFIGFLIGLLLLLLLLVCCACCCHWLLLLLRRLTSGQAPSEDEGGASGPLRTAAAEHLSGSSRRRRLRRRLAALRVLGGGGGVKGRQEAMMAGRGRAELGETDSLARGQNMENAARLKARSLLEPMPDQRLMGQSMQQQQQQQQQPHRIQSILKRPAGEYKAAPLARFEAIPSGQSGLEYEQQQAPPPPPRAPSRHATEFQRQQQQHQEPSPRRGALASSMTSAARSSGRFTSALAAAGDFRPTPAARATALRSGLQSQSPQLAPSRVQQPQVPFHRSQQPQARAAGDDDNDQSNRRTVVVRAPSPSGEPLPPVASDSDRLKFKSKITKLEQTSTVTGSERVTVYQYSSNMAQFSESYLMKQRLGEASQQQHHHQQAISSSSTTTTTTRSTRPPEPSPSGDDQPPELPPKTRQSSLI